VVVAMGLGSVVLAVTMFFAIKMCCLCCTVPAAAEKKKKKEEEDSPYTIHGPGGKKIDFLTKIFADKLFFCS
jgi:hypothetical protein